MSGVPDPIGKITVLLLTPLYLLLLATILSKVNFGDHLVSIAAVFTGAAALVAIIAVLRRRLAKLDERKSGFSISTLMLLTVGFSIYLAYISQFMNHARPLEYSLYGISVFLFYCTFFIAVTTFVLIQFTDALLALTAWASGFFGRFAGKK